METRSWSYWIVIGCGAALAPRLAVAMIEMDGYTVPDIWRIGTLIWAAVILGGVLVTTLSQAGKVVMTAEMSRGQKILLVSGWVLLQAVIVSALGTLSLSHLFGKGWDEILPGFVLGSIHYGMALVVDLSAVMACTVEVISQRQRKREALDEEREAREAAEDLLATESARVQQLEEKLEQRREDESQERAHQIEEGKIRDAIEALMADGEIRSIEQAMADLEEKGRCRVGKQSVSTALRQLAESHYLRKSLDNDNVFLYQLN